MSVIWTSFSLGAAKPPQSSSGKDADSSGKTVSEEVDAQRIELRNFEKNVEASEADQTNIQTEIDSIKNDRAELVKALLETTQKLDLAENEINASEANLAAMKGSEEAIQISLNSRRTVIAGIIFRLQRLSRNPFPVFLESPDDVLKALRTSALFIGVLPKLRTEIDALGADLNEIARLRKTAELTHDAMAEALKQQHADRQRLTAMIEARQSALSEAEKAYEAENARRIDAARKAANLKDLIKNLEENKLSPPEEPAAGEGAFDNRPNGGSPAGRDAFGLAFHNPSRLSPVIPFSDAKGLLPLPVPGFQIRNFGSPDGFGGSQKGISISTRNLAVVTSPCDGWVVFSGSYRTYGQLLIINAGQGYYIILAGMDRIVVNSGQFVLSGEPVAFMGDGRSKATSAASLESNQPFLYVEFRKDGASIDPGPWWVKPELQKVRG